MKLEKHLKYRPRKTIYPKELQVELRKKVINKIKAKLLPDNKIIKIVLMGSSVKLGFGEYESPGFRRSLYSDFDFIVFVKDDYKISKWFRREPTGKPFPDKKLNLAYRNKKFIDKKYDVEVFFIRESNANNKKIQKLGEKAGIPMTSKSKNKNMVIYRK